LPPAKSFADYGSAENLRKVIAEQIMQGIQAGIIQPVDWTGMVKQDIQIPTRDGESIRAVRYAPESQNDGPLFVYFHGGGWTFGFPEAWESGVEVLTKELGFVVLSVDYRLAPGMLNSHTGRENACMCADTLRRAYFSDGPQ
jgi:poly(3-hydroxybutyrate) depolymerase